MTLRWPLSHDRPTKYVERTILFPYGGKLDFRYIITAADDEAIEDCVDVLMNWQYHGYPEIRDE